MLPLNVRPHPGDLSLWIAAAPTVSSPPSETQAAGRHGGSITKKRLHFILGLRPGFLPGRDYISHRALE